MREEKNIDDLFKESKIKLTKKKPARKKGKKDNTIFVYLSDSEFEEVKGEADKIGLSLSAYARMKLFS